MEGMKWIKIMTDIFDNDKITLIECLPDGDSVLVIWFKLLCLAGKNNNSGVFTIAGHIPYSEEMFSKIFRKDISLIRTAFEMFEKFGMIERTDGIVTLPGWGKHQSVDNVDSIREKSRKRSAEYRKRQKLLAAASAENASDKDRHAPVTPPSRDVTPVEEEGEKEGEEDEEVICALKSADPTLAKALSEWFSYKREKKEPCTKASVKNLISIAQRYAKDYGSSSVADVVRLSISNGWRGVIWDRLKNTGFSVNREDAYDYDEIERKMWANMKGG